MPFAIVTPQSQVRSLVVSSIQPVVIAAKTFGDFLYGDEIRTKRSLTFAYASVAFYLVTLINAQSYVACSY